MRPLEVRSEHQCVAAAPERRGSGIVLLKRGETSWKIQPQLADLFLNDSGLRFDDWKRNGALHVVKTGPHRTVYRLELPSGRYYLKHYRVPDLRALAQNVLRPCKAVLEWRGMEGLVRSALPTFEAVAVGRTLRAGMVWDNYLISRAIESAEPLDEFLTRTFPHFARKRQARIRRDLSRSLGQLAGRMHQAGVLQKDFHAGNILIRIMPDEALRLWIIDLHTIGLDRTPSLAIVKENFAVFHQFFVGKVTATDRLRFLRAYGAVRGAHGAHEFRISRPAAASARATDRGTPPELVREFEEYSLRAKLRMWRRADRHWSRGNRHVAKFDVPGTKCRGLAKLDHRLLVRLRDDPDALFDRNVKIWCKTSGKHRVAGLVLPVAGQDTLCYWKRCRTHWLWHLLSKFGGHTCMRHAWEIGHAFLRRGIATPKPLAIVERKRSPQPMEYLLTEGVPRSIDLGRFLEDRFGELSPGEARDWLRRYSRRLARQIATLHSFGYDHRDLKASNILVSEDPTETRTWLLDLDAVRRWTWLPRQRRIQNLARLNVSSLNKPMIRNTDRLRVLVAYLGDQPDLDWKSYWKRIAERTSRKIQKNRHSGRPVH